MARQTALLGGRMLEVASRLLDQGFRLLDQAEMCLAKAVCVGGLTGELAEAVLKQAVRLEIKAEALISAADLLTCTGQAERERFFELAYVAEKVGNGERAEFFLRKATDC